MEDIDDPCPFCGGVLTDVDGMLECQEGCHAHEDWTYRGSETVIPWYYKKQYLFVYKWKQWIRNELIKSGAWFLQDRLN